MGIFTYEPADRKGAESPLREGRIAVASLAIFALMGLLSGHTRWPWPFAVGVAAFITMIIIGTSVVARADRRLKERMSERMYERLDEQYEQNLETRRRMGIGDDEP